MMTDRRGGLFNTHLRSDVLRYTARENSLQMLICPFWSSDTRQNNFLFFLQTFLFFPLLFLKGEVRRRSMSSYIPWTSVHFLPAFLFFFVCLLSLSLSLFPFMPRRCLRDKLDYPDASSTRRSLMGSAVSTGFQNSLMIGQLPRDCDLSRIPSLPDR